MPRKVDHREVRDKLARLSPESLQAITVRLPAELLIKVHQWAETQKLDLASAVRTLLALGHETAVHPEHEDSGTARKAVRKWRRDVERALRAGRSPIEPFLGQNVSDADFRALPLILARADYRTLYEALKKRLEGETSPAAVAWREEQAEAPTHLRPLLAALDNLEAKFLARKKVFWTIGHEDSHVTVIHWFLSDQVMQMLKEASSTDKDVEATRRLIAARYLTADTPARPWDFTWDA
jgi:hypothetical protein